jgi:hypothetical protein
MLIVPPEGAFGRVLAESANVAFCLEVGIGTMSWLKHGKNCRRVTVAAGVVAPVWLLWGLAQGAGIGGTDGSEQIFGTAGDDTIYGYGGQDQIFGYGGNDRIDGGPDGDAIYGGVGDDVIFKGPGNDHVFGDEGNDRIVVRHACELQQGSVNLNGDAGTDTLVLPIPLATYLAAGHVATGFEAVVVDTSLGCDSPCAPAWECPDTSSGTDSDGTGTGDDTTTTFDDSSNLNDSNADDWTFNDSFSNEDTVSGEIPEDDNDTSNSQGEDECLNKVRLVYETSCPHSPDANVPPVAGVGACTWGDFPNRRWVTSRTTSNTCLQDIHYCKIAGYRFAQIDDGNGGTQVVSRPNYQEVFFPSVEPPPGQGQVCVAVPTNPACQDQRKHKGLANDDGGTTTAGCAAMESGTVYRTCTSSADCNIGGKQYFCVAGQCTDCAEFLVCPDPEASDDAIEDLKVMPFTEPGMIPQAANANNDDKPKPPTGKLPSSEDEACTTPNSCRSHETRFNFCAEPPCPDVVAPDMRGVDPCNWDAKMSSKSGKTPNWGLGGDYEPPAPGGDPEEDRPGYWHRIKGNDRFNLEIKGIVKQEGRFAGAFADGTAFHVGAEASFTLDAVGTNQHPPQTKREPISQRRAANA